MSITLAELREEEQKGKVYLHFHIGRSSGLQIWRQNGAIKVWKTIPDKYCMPIKYGLYAYGYLTDTDDMYLANNCPVCTHTNNKEIN